MYDNVRLVAAEVGSPEDFRGEVPPPLSVLLLTYTRKRVHPRLRAHARNNDTRIGSAEM